MGASCEAQNRCSKMSFAGGAAAGAKAAAEAIEAELAAEDLAHLGLRERMHAKSNPTLRERSLSEIKKEAFDQKVRVQVTSKRDDVMSALEVTTGQSPISKARSTTVRRGSVGAGVVLPAEVDRLGHRAHVVVSGKLAEIPERPFETKIMAMKGLANVAELVEDQQVGIRCVNGSSPAFVRPNQDDFFFVTTSDLYRIAAVFDGHGSSGHTGSAIVRDVMLRTLLGHLPWSNDVKEGEVMSHAQNMADGMALAFEKANAVLLEHQEFDPRLSGVSACLVVHDVKHHWLHVAWVGNCRCVIADLQEERVEQQQVEAQDGQQQPKKQKTAKKSLVAVPLSTDHTTKNQEERARVQQAGAELRFGKHDHDHPEVCAPGEALPGIPLTRCLGNLVAHQLGVNDQVQCFNRAMVCPGKDARFLILATDGLWDVLRNSEVVATLHEGKKENIEFSINHVVSKAHDAWVRKAHKVGNVIDDITVIVMWLRGLTGIDRNLMAPTSPR